MREQHVVICRSAPPRETLFPGAKLGHVCDCCKEPLQITSGGLRILAVDPDAITLCNDCGLVYAQVAEDFAKTGVVEIETRVSPTAQRQLDSGNDSPLAQWTRRK